MDNVVSDRLELILGKTEADLNTVLKSASSAVGSLKKLHAAVSTGNLHEIKKMMESAEQSIVVLEQQFNKAKEGWNFDSEGYLGSRAFIDEFIEISEAKGLNIFEQDERLYCYPFLVRILPNECAVLIDKTKERHLRPSALVSRLKALQSKPVRFKSEAFLESLFAAYQVVQKSEDQIGTGVVVPLVTVYKLLTLLPGQAKEYTLQEFARDIYLLDLSGTVKTKDGFSMSLPASTGTKSPRNSIRVITREGQEKRYYGISFLQAKGE